MKLAGRRTIITGASQGFGLAVAQAYLREGADLLLCARDGERLATAQRALRASETRAGAQVAARVADVSCAGDVDALVAQALRELGGLDVLVCNAGVYGPLGPVEEVDWAEWEQAIRINLLGVVHCCRAVLPHFKRQRGGKIIVLSGGGATRPLPFISAYAASKAGVVRFAETLAEEVATFGVDVNSVAPGALNTRLLDQVLAAAPEQVGRKFFESAVKQKESGGTPLDVGAQLCVFLASRASDGITGRLLSAVWDPWERLPGHAAELAASDIYTLRRIVPEDRAQKWD